MRRAGRLVAGAGVAWSGLCVALSLDGQVPSGPTGPVAPADWYALQAALLPPLLLLLWRVQAGVTRALRAGPADPTAALGRVYAAAVFGCLVLPESLAFTAGGMAALRAVAPMAGGALVLAAWGGSAWALRRVWGLGWGGALARSLPGLLVQAALGAPFLR